VLSVKEYQHGPEGSKKTKYVSDYRSEFQQILSGACGRQKKDIAEEFFISFRPVPPEVHPPEYPMFEMGSPPEEVGRIDNELLHETSIDKAFEMACFPVTNEQYELFDPSHESRLSPSPDGPVTGVSWYDARAFCLWLGEDYRLPKETLFPRHAWCPGNSWSQRAGPPLSTCSH